MPCFHARYKKYHQETIKKSIKSLYKKKGKESGGQEWVCTNCDLTFDNASLLNLHTLTHAAEDIGTQTNKYPWLQQHPKCEYVKQAYTVCVM